MDNLSNSEILAMAQEIRAREGTMVLTPEESQIVFRADAIVNARRGSGIAGLVEGALSKIVGQRRSAEAALEKARQDEARIENLLAEKAGLEKNLTRHREVLARLREMTAAAVAAATPESEGRHFLTRFAHSDHYSLPEHLKMVALEIAQRRIVAEYLPLYVERQEQVVSESETRVKEIAKAVSKL